MKLATINGYMDHDDMETKVAQFLIASSCKCAGARRPTMLQVEVLTMKQHQQVRHVH